MQRRQHQQRQWSQIILWTVLIVAFIAGSVGIIVHEALRPSKTAAEQTVSIARQKGISSASDFLTYNRQHTYYSVSGKNAKNQAVYVVVAKQGGKTQVLKRSAGTSKTAILRQVWQKDNPKKVLNIGLGIRKHQPVWEVTYLNQKGNLCYDLLRFKDGTMVQSIQNL
ncbi:MAG TPA: peptidase [Lactobacillus sp.]|nr:peptidase [Lactobacillus sp.]